MSCICKDCGVDTTFSLDIGANAYGSLFLLTTPERISLNTLACYYYSTQMTSPRSFSSAAGAFH
jgi:hypothetical protein